MAVRTVTARAWRGGAVLLLGACGGGGDEGAVAARPPALREVAASSGLLFVHHNGGSGRFDMPEIMGGGGALFDVDQDGDLDVYLVQGAGGPHGDRLYRNDLAASAEGRTTVRFIDISDRLPPLPEPGMGVAAADFDGDGRVDLYRTALSRNRLLRNLGDRFADVSEESGTANHRWSVGAAFADLDRDGLLDLYVANYLDYRGDSAPRCSDTTGAPDYCPPARFHYQGDRLYRQVAPGRFEDVSKAAFPPHDAAPALGVLASDLDHDGRVDIYVANDGEPNRLWRNLGGFRFEDVAIAAGCALGERGQAYAGMGVAAEDIDGDADLDLVVTNLAGEPNTLFQNDGGDFTERSAALGLAAPSLTVTSFGVAFLDLDGDGTLDLATANGAISSIPELARAGDPHPFHQEKQLYRGSNRSAGTMVFALDDSHHDLARRRVGRGLARGDIDNDGDPDLLVINNHGPVELLRNDSPPPPFVGLRLVEGPGPADAGDARAAVVVAGHPVRWRRAHSDGSYASASDPRVLISLRDLGLDRERVTVRVRWPGGDSEEFELRAGRYTTLLRGSGRPVGATT